MARHRVVGDSPAARRARSVDLMAEMAGPFQWSLLNHIEQHQDDDDVPERTPEQEARNKAHIARSKAEVMESYPLLRSRSYRRAVARCRNFRTLSTRTPVPRREGRRASHGTQPGHRRPVSSRAGPDPDSDQPPPCSSRCPRLGVS